MDLSTIVGIMGGLGVIVAAIGPSKLIIFVSVPSFLIVVIGSIGAFLVNYPFADIKIFIAVMLKTLKYKTVEPDEIIPMLIDFGGKARRDGILVLQQESKNIDNPFLNKGIQLAIDGTEPQMILKILETEVEYVKERHRLGAEMSTAMGTYLPAFGMIGTLVGLVLMLQSLDDPSTIGPSMAIALITTFYGALIANLMFLPMSGKLKKRSADETLLMEVMIEGIVSIASGDNPRIMEQKLHAFLLPKLRKSQFD
ncbi:Flagellar motor rotation protein MotA [hydrothermal vent metagenome]|uniref:Flagellar motor rotation protein MotA n=1 Tax=hydrothermal vent metagenome TaxID=652676 RepID=A0A3B1CJC2_9ZZZZ